MTRLLSRHFVPGCAVSALIAMVMGGSGQVAFAQSDGAIHACVNARGALRIVASNEPCLRLESPLSWNTQAPDATAPQFAGSLTVNGIAVGIYSLTWGNQAGGSGTGAGGAGGHPVFSTFNVVKGVDLLTPRLLTASFVGQRLSNTTIVFYALGTTTPLVSYLLEDAIISSVSFGAAGGQVTESVSFVPAGRMITRINMPTAAQPSACWDISRNEEC